MNNENCMDCKLCESRTHIVNGKGNLVSKVLFVGEAPGKEEDKWGLPFIGMAGGELSDIIKIVNLSWSTCRIENVVRCRPPKNRVPYRDEIQTCSKYLIQIIQQMKPEIIFTLGNTATKWFCGDSRYEQGKLYFWKRTPQDTDIVKIVPMYHLSWIVYGMKEGKYRERKEICLGHIAAYSNIIADILVDKGYQIRHENYGVFQGELMGLGYWSPLSQVPQLGYYRFSTMYDALEYIKMMCSTMCLESLEEALLNVEPFNKEESEKLKAQGIISGTDKLM